jgi:hypothetical protein
MDKEFVPLDAFIRAMRLWWLVALLGILGGVSGFVFHRLRPPLYESQAVYHASLDFNQAGQFIKPNDLSLSQYDEDLALEAVHAALIAVEPLVITGIQQQNINLDLDTLQKNSIIERDHAYWKIRFRHTDPIIAQKVVAMWTDAGTRVMGVFQKEGTMKPYVIYQLVSPASLPTQPTYLKTNQVVLAGGLIGLVAGILLTSLNLPFIRK